ncbi:IclR family transcriptional regulator C-terminal domain-containing protein [Streptomyces sp. CBG33]|uniref:IclR family transcriptional regulator domain-containing protein n=1 Tax=Streptomyces sp. CBG33 TaxID=2762624 RepID=UPI0028F6E4FE|nr:IclR family transcriptional regulator C-terminal domain-containing protein [Streptomyces sp. CBG33]
MVGVPHSGGAGGARVRHLSARGAGVRAGGGGVRDRVGLSAARAAGAAGAAGGAAAGGAARADRAPRGGLRRRDGLSAQGAPAACLRRRHRPRHRHRRPAPRPPDRQWPRDPRPPPRGPGPRPLPAPRRPHHPDRPGPRSLAELLDLLAADRARGWSEETELVSEGLRSLGTAVFDHHGHPVAALSTTWRRHYAPHDPERVREELGRAAARLTSAVSGRAPGAG